MSLYETHKLQNQKIPLICMQSVCAKGGSHDHGNWHENIEVIFVVEGTGTVVNHDQHLRVKKNDILVINANCLHSFYTNERLQYYYLIIDRAFCLSNHFDTNKICFEPQFCDDEIAEIIQTLMTEVRSDESTPYRVPMIRAELLRMMVLLCRRHATEKDTPFFDSRLLSCIKQAIGFIHSECSREISLEEVSKLVGLSKFYFSREFRRITGYTFLSYTNMIRCTKAKQFLAESDLSIGEIARTCGFENQSYFSRTFLKCTGLLPSAYRKKKRNEQL